MFECLHNTVFIDVKQGLAMVLEECKFCSEPDSDGSPLSSPQS